MLRIHLYRQPVSFAGLKIFSVTRPRHMLVKLRTPDTIASRQRQLQVSELEARPCGPRAGRGYMRFSLLPKSFLPIR